TQAAFHKTDDLVAARVGSDEIGLAFVEREQPVLIGREAEERSVPLDPLDRCALRTAADVVLAERGLVLCVVGFVAHRVPARVTIEINVAICGHPSPDFLAGAMMLLFRGADEAVERDVKALIHRSEPRRVASRDL